MTKAMRIKRITTSQHTTALMKKKTTNEILVDLQQQSRLTNSGILKVGFEADWVAVNSGKSQICTLLLLKIAS